MEAGSAGQEPTLMKLRRRTAIGALGILALVGVAAALIWTLASYGGGPAYDSDLAARSLVTALGREHPKAGPVHASCNGSRDGSHFFSCQLSGGRAGVIPPSTTVSYSDSSDRYESELGGGADGQRRLVFPPVD